MTRALPRTNFHSSNLIRYLTDLAVIDTTSSGSAFAEQLGQWIHFADAISLSAVHNNGTAAPAKMQSNAVQLVVGEIERIQTVLTNSIITSCSPNASKVHNRLPALSLDMSMDFAAAYEPYRQFYEGHQRDMELSIQALRINVREAIAKASPNLKKLAELDATFEKILRDRESKLLSKIPVLLKKYFGQLFEEHQRELVDKQQARTLADSPQIPDWLARFCNHLQMLLLAELELRLQPAMGLIEALKQDTQ